MSYIVNEEQVMGFEVPPETATYKPIPNKMIIDTVREVIERQGMTILSKEYRANTAKTQVASTVVIASEDEEMNMMLGYYNSSDKSRCFGIAAGAHVFVCGNGMLHGEFTSIRKHQGKLQEELEYVIYRMVRNLRSYFDNCIREREQLKSVSLTLPMIHELTGEMFISEDLMSSTLLCELTRQFQENEHFAILDRKNLLLEGKTMWDFYNLCTQTFKSEGPINFMRRHAHLNHFMVDKSLKYLNPSLISTTVTSLKNDQPYEQKPVREVRNFKVQGVS